MSLIPMLASLAREVDDYHVGLHSLGDDFGFGIYPTDIHRLRTPSLHLVPLRRFSPYERSLQSIRGKPDSKENLTVGKDGFQVCMDVSQFKPNELTVKTVGNHVVVEGKHEEREDDHGYISRQFVRKYHLPKGYDAKDVVSTVSTDGVLTVKAPPPSKALKSNERVVQIQQTGPAHLCVKSNEKEENGTNTVQSDNGKKAEVKQ